MRTSAWLWSALLLSACSSTPIQQGTEPTEQADAGAAQDPDEDSDDDGPGACTETDCDSPEPCPSGSACDDDADAGGDDDTGAVDDACGKNELSGLRPTPNVMILLDRSGSMDDDAGDDTRWNVAKKAIDTVTSTFDDEIRFGLTTYSSCIDNGCSAGTIVVPIGERNAGSIQAFLANKADRGSEDGAAVDGDEIEYLCDSGDPETSTGQSLFALLGEDTLQDPGRDNAVLLITDGEESDECIEDDRDAKAGASALSSQAVPVRTFVIGLGVNADSLDEVAQAGDTDQLLSADDEAQLTEALSRVARQAISCNFVLDQQPADITKIYVFFNDEPTQIPRDDPDGYRYDATSKTVIFEGASCDALRELRVTDVDVVFGCPEPVVL